MSPAREGSRKTVVISLVVVLLLDAVGFAQAKVKLAAFRLIKAFRKNLNSDNNKVVDDPHLLHHNTIWQYQVKSQVLVIGPDQVSNRLSGLMNLMII